MSDTPRTEHAAWNDNYGKVPIEFTRKLERENDQLAKQCVKNVEEIGELRAALAISEKKELATRAVIESWKQAEGAKAKRLEWILESIFLMDSPHDILSSCEAIDKAMEAANNE